MTGDPELSICIVSWNGRELVRKLLRSIETAREGLSLETILVDNGSSDGTADSVAAEFPEVVLVRSGTNLGFASANILAVERARGRLLLFLNNDVVVLPGALRELVSFLDRHPGAAAVGPRLLGDDGLPQETGRNLPSFPALLHRIRLLRWTGLFRRAYRRYRSGGFHPHRSGPVEQLAAAALLVRREQLAASGGWDGGFEFGVEDVDLCARLGRLGTIHYLAEAAMEHRGRVSSRANRPRAYRGYECGHARYLRKHHPRRGAAPLYKLLVTMDMPLRVGLLGAQCLGRRLRGRSEQARESRRKLHAAGEFLVRGLPALWRS